MTNNKLEVVDFQNSALALLPNPGTQIQYVLKYLSDLSAISAIQELEYFDRDYLSEFEAFYCTSIKGYPNTCIRIHYFSNDIRQNNLFLIALGGDNTARQELSEHYLGFVTLKPITNIAIGKTVLKIYPDSPTSTPRIVRPVRKYTCHVAGIELEVDGLAWQQQDSAVGACATIALWSIFQSIAFSEWNSIPTTAQVTRSAHKKLSLGTRLFPSNGLSLHQICEAILDQGLSPMVIEGDNKQSSIAMFTKDSFLSNCASFIRSGYPVLIAGHLYSQTNQYMGGHATCAIGFRDSHPPTSTQNQLVYLDGNVNQLYVHDDNIGPQVRFRIENHYNVKDAIQIRPDEPSGQKTLLSGYPVMVPQALIVAVNNEIRITPEQLGKLSFEYISPLITSLGPKLQTGFNFSLRFIKQMDYLGGEIGGILNSNPTLLSRVRWALADHVKMSFFLGIVRIGVNQNAYIDIIFDVSDSVLGTEAIAYVAYQKSILSLVPIIESQTELKFGKQIDAT